MLKFKEVNEVRETREEKEKRVTKESRLAKLVKERKGDIEMNENILDQPIVKEINNDKGEIKMEIKDYVGYMVENKEVNLEDFEMKFMELEKARLDKVIPIQDIREFIRNAEIALKDIDVIDETELTIFEGLKAARIMMQFAEEGDTYRTFNEKIAKDQTVRRMYNIITQNVFNIYKNDVEDLTA